MKETRTKLAGHSMLVGGGVIMIPPWLGRPDGSDDTVGKLNALAKDPTTPLAKSLLFQLGLLLILPGVLAVFGRTTGGRGAKVVLSGAVVYVAGLVPIFTFVAVEGAQADLATSGPITPSLVEAADALGSSGALIPAMVLGFLLWHLLGLPWMTWGMVRNGQIRWHVALLATLGTLGAFFGSGTTLETIGWELLGISFGLLAMSLLRPSTDPRRTTNGC